MSNRLKTYNALYKILDSENINILYKPSNTCFDLILSLLDINVYSYYSNSNDIENYYYDAYMTSSIIEHSNMRNKILLDYGIPDVLCFHNLLPSKFKKEDLYILKKSSILNHKIFFHDTIQNSWSIKDKLSFNITYGLPNIPVKSITNKKSAIILNLNNNNNLNTLYQFIKNVFKDTEMITDISSFSYQQLVDKLSEFHICLENDSIINCLVAAYAGCHIVSTLPNIEDVSGSFNITDYSEVVDQIKGLISNIKESDKNILLNQYSFDRFSSQFIKCLKQIKKVPPLL